MNTSCRSPDQPKFEVSWPAHGLFLDSWHLVAFYQTEQGFRDCWGSHQAISDLTTVGELSCDEEGSETFESIALKKILLAAS